MRANGPLKIDGPKIYGIEAGRCITMNGLKIATLGAVRGPDGLYNIGGPTEMDEFARTVVEALNWWEATKEEAEHDLRR